MSGRVIENGVAVRMRRPQKLSVEDAREIRRRYALGEKPAAIARCYRVHRNTAWHILNDRTWRDSKTPSVGEAPTPPPQARGRGKSPLPACAAGTEQGGS